MISTIAKDMVLPSRQSQSISILQCFSIAGMRGELKENVSLYLKSTAFDWSCHCLNLFKNSSIDSFDVCFSAWRSFLIESSVTVQGKNYLRKRQNDCQDFVKLLTQSRAHIKQQRPTIKTRFLNIFLGSTKHAPSAVSIKCFQQSGSHSWEPSNLFTPAIWRVSWLLLHWFQEEFCPPNNQLALFWLFLQDDLPHQLLS